MREDAGRTMTLGRGGYRQVYMAAGATILMRGGSVVLRCAPDWLAESYLRSQQRLDAEDVHVASVAGWVELHALSAAEWVVISAPSSARWLYRCFTAWLGRGLAKGARYG